jgi:DHA1 family bicyclomycin/chloramphenicol resistance-like MFS transporter
MPRFLGFTFFNGFVSASFFAYITAASYIMIEVLERPAAEYGLWFLTLPAAYLLGNFVAGRFGGRARIEFMVLLGSGIALAASIGFVFAAAIMPLTPLVLFLPCFIASIGQGIAMPNAQSGAIMVDPQLTGTAAGTVMFAHLCLGATGAQVMGFLADGTMMPMALMYVTCCALATAAALVPALIRETRPATS